MKWIDPPELPAESEWHFVDDLRSPLKRNLNWPPRKPKGDEASFANGTCFEWNFPDPHALLTTAYDDFDDFLKNARVNREGSFVFSTEKVDWAEEEAWRIEVGVEGCRIMAGDTEGIRRAIFYLEDEMHRRTGPFLPIGTFERKSFVKTRISRCFFGPIKRPPQNRDELADDVNYYPDEYLNRLTHEGINALWLTTSFPDLCPNHFFPEHGKHCEYRLEKLRKTVDQCARYGIKIYIFCIEPMGFGSNGHHCLPLSSLENNPQFAGHRANGHIYFCTSTEDGKAYLRECAKFIFSNVPGLGGMIDINMGERATHCYSSLDSLINNNCPRCSKRKPGEVFADTLSALADGMHEANPKAEMISWLYVPSLTSYNGIEIETSKRFLREIAAHIPRNVTFQYNFESGGITEQLGKKRMVVDYFLSWPGPSDIFADCAKNAAANGARTSAKIQVGCSHEVATIPFVPVPGLLYQKYKAMRDLGVSTVMQCWYFGNYPGLMNKAAGELAFEKFPSTEDEFLLKLAKTDWGKHAETVVNAWKYFQKGYSNSPINVMFTHYSPVHHSVVWPLYLFPVDTPISPSWKFTFPLEGGDRIGECIFYNHTLDEILVLMKRMRDAWEKGVALMESVEANFKNDHERTLDIGLCKALGLQIASAQNVLTFYAMREGLPYQKSDNQSTALAKMKKIVEEEIDNSRQLAALCEKDSRLGFHSEAEGYKYYPAKLEWRARLLEELLKTDFPKLESQIEDEKPLFTEYTGVNPQGKIYRCQASKEDAAWERLQGEFPTKWRAFHDEQAIHLDVVCSIYHDGRVEPKDTIDLEIEPCRLWPVKRFSLSRDGEFILRDQSFFQDKRWNAEASDAGKEWTARFTIPWTCFDGYHRDKRPMRINIYRHIEHKEYATWLKKNPWPSRLSLRDDNPADLGWLVFE